MKFSYASVALPTLTPEEAVAALAAAGYRGVEWKVGEAPHATSSNVRGFLVGNRCTIPISVDAAARIGRICAEAGLAVVGLGPYLSIDDDASLRTVVDMAVASGAPQIRLQAPRFSGGGSYADLFDRTLRYLERAVPILQAADRRMVIEMHQYTIAPSASLAYRLVQHFDPRLIGVIYDTGNMVVEGYEDPRIGLDLLGGYLHHVHLKNAAALRDDGGWRYVWTPLDDGLVNVQGVLGELAKRGYQGWISLEDLSTARAPAAALAFNASVLQQLPEAEW